MAKRQKINTEDPPTGVLTQLSLSSSQRSEVDEAVLVLESGSNSSTSQVIADEDSTPHLNLLSV
eukprot:TRINITY_DN3512_c0_g1_i1.p1 TRINITY_DN3512_c0_g1~~TRINITY_DN3512_c0_g1_i1.p1  ORF type:complete len:64 (-),score=5.81 TRINITY_DN3512_c0_g1_i1:130-321(-)